MGDEITVNDGKGLLNSEGLIDSLVVDCNNLTKLLIDNQFVAYGNTIAQMYQKLKLLKDGIKADYESMRREIADLRKFVEDNHA